MLNLSFQNLSLGWVMIVLGSFFTILGIISATWGNFILYKSAIKKGMAQEERIIDNNNSNTNKLDEGISELNEKSEEWFKKIIASMDKDDFMIAIELYNKAELKVKIAVISKLQQLAIDNINKRQMIIDFLCNLNDWISTAKQLKSPKLNWASWLYHKKLFTDKTKKIIEEEKQRLSLESSIAIGEILFEHVKRPSSVVLTFHKKNLLGMIFWDTDFKHKNIDFSTVNFYGVNFRNVKNIDTTHFQECTYYGYTIFSKMSLPKKINFHNLEIGTNYYGNINFEEVIFPQGASFTGTYFKNDVNFSNVVFLGKAEFYIVNFKGNAIFSRCEFKGEAGFNGSNFHKTVSLTHSTFLEKTQFVTVTFKGEKNFSGNKFKFKPDIKDSNLEIQ